TLWQVVAIFHQVRSGQSRGNRLHQPFRQGNRDAPDFRDGAHRLRALEKGSEENMREDDDDRPEPEIQAPDMPTTPLTDPIRERLFKSRTLVISGEVNQKLASSVTAQLLALAADSDDPITIFFNSQGGHVESGDTIHDMIQFVKPRVRMVGTGWVASAGALIFVAVPKADRYC